jgi:hypothetical protein
MTTTNINAECTPLKTDVFLFGDDHIKQRRVKRFGNYTHEPNKNSFSMVDDSDDDDHLILSGRCCCL